MKQSDEKDLDRVAAAYFRYCSKSASKEEQESSAWAYDLVSDWSFEASGESLWNFVMFAYPLDMIADAKAVFAAGPVEDVLAKFGEQYIDRVEKLARQDPKFNELLGGVWQSTMTDEIWSRVQKVRSRVW